MPFHWRANLPDDSRFVLIAALSGRALAACARRAGYRPLVADLFGDRDTRDLAEACEVVPGSLSRGFARGALLAALDRLAAGRLVTGVVTGAGFEDRTILLRDLAARYGLLGNAQETVAAMKNPWMLADACARAGIGHPQIAAERPACGDWLRKRVGGSGGVHVDDAPDPAGSRRGRYWQRRIAGEPISLTFLAAGGACRVLGISRQWADPTPRQPFRYGGAVRQAAMDPAMSVRLCEAVARLVELTDLRGLNSADFLVRDDGFDLLEINPRPGATLDLFADREGALFDLHLSACAGVLPDDLPSWPAASAAAIVYAPTKIRLPAGFIWPPWTADRQPQGETVPSGGPLCTVLAEAADAAAAEHLVRERAEQITAMAMICQGVPN